MTDCEEFRRALGRLRDGEEAGADEAAVRAHAASCPECAADGKVLDAVGLRLRERGGDEAAPVPAGLRDAVLARLRAGEAIVIDLRPFLLRSAAAAAAVLVLSGGVPIVLDAVMPRIDSHKDPLIHRDEIVAEIVRLQMGPGR